MGTEKQILALRLDDGTMLSVGTIWWPGFPVSRDAMSGNWITSIHDEGTGLYLIDTADGFQIRSPAAYAVAVCEPVLNYDESGVPCGISFQHPPGTMKGPYSFTDLAGILWPEASAVPAEEPVMESIWERSNPEEKRDQLDLKHPGDPAPGRQMGACSACGTIDRFIKCRLCETEQCAECGAPVGLPYHDMTLQGGQWVVTPPASCQCQNAARYFVLTDADGKRHRWSLVVKGNRVTSVLDEVDGEAAVSWRLVRGTRERTEEEQRTFTENLEKEIRATAARMKALEEHDLPRRIDGLETLLQESSHRGSEPVTTKRPNAVTRWSTDWSIEFGLDSKPTAFYDGIRSWLIGREQ